MTFANTALDLGNFLSYLSRRQEVVASNIANADTPGYKTRDLPPPQAFSDLLHESSLGAEEISGLPARNDGNNVSMDREARILAENTLRFNLASQMIKGEIRDLKSAITEGR
ncbi:MAG: flagellar basal body protein [Terriglobia bacterium]